MLPLENLSGDPEQEYFADGMTEALISGLAKIKALKVISRHLGQCSIRAHEQAPAGDCEGVERGCVVLGARCFGRATAFESRFSLIDGGQTDQHLWTESYERESDADILATAEVR